MADAIVEAAVTQIGSLLLDEGRALYAVKGKVEYLYRELEMMHVFLREMDSRKEGEYSEVVHKAISWIRDLAYEAEDIVEKYSNGVTHRRELEEISHILKWFFCGFMCNPCDAVAQHQVGADVDVLREKLQHVNSQLQRYTIGESICVNSNNSSRTVGQQEIENKAFVNMLEEDPIGLDQATEDLTKKLALTDIKVISIFGMGGLGKSTLAKRIYNKVKRDFDCFAWVFVSQQFQRYHVWREITIQLDKGMSEHTNNNMSSYTALSNELHDILKRKRCLVVLDDLWTDADWMLNDAPKDKLLAVQKKCRLADS